MSERSIVVMCAIPQEREALRGALADPVRHHIGRRSVTEGVLEGHRVVLGEAGIGKVNAAVVTTRLVDRFEPSAILFTGVAGGLDPELHVGDVVIGERTIHHDAGVIEGERVTVHQAGHVPFFNPSDRLGYTPSPELLDAARRAAGAVALQSLSETAGGSGRDPRVAFGTILTGDQFLNCSTTRDRLHAEFGAQAIEMEGAAVAQAAEELGVDCLVVRALSDLAGADSTLDFAQFLDQVAANSAAVVRAIVREMS